MTDVLSPEQRHRNMANIKSVNTKPEKIVRSLLHNLGYRFRLHSNKLVGKPDIVLSKHKKIIFVNGCFWHMHKCKYGKVIPKTNAEFWKNKRLLNKKRDIKTKEILERQGWKILIVWECQIRDKNKLKKRLIDFLSKS